MENKGEFYTMSQQSIEEIKKNLPPLSVHPSNKTPRMTAEKLEALKLDILLAGKLYKTIWLRDGKIFDGKNVYEACRRLKEEGRLNFEPDIQEWPFPDDDADAAFDSLNLHRNHFNANQIAAYIAIHRLDDLKLEADGRMRNGNREIPMELIPQGRKGSAYEIAAILYGSNSKYMQYASDIKNENIHYLDFVLSNQMSLKEGKSFIQLDEDVRNYVFAQMKNGAKYKEAFESYQASLSPEETDSDEIANTTNTGKAKKIIDAPSVIFTIPVDDDVANEILELLALRYGQATLTHTVWDVKQHEKIAAKIAAISKAVERNGE